MNNEETTDEPVPFPVWFYLSTCTDRDTEYEIKNQSCFLINIELIVILTCLEYKYSTCCILKGNPGKPATYLIDMHL
jgi:hypothetical protein